MGNDWLGLGGTTAAWGCHGRTVSVQRESETYHVGLTADADIRSTSQKYILPYLSFTKHDSWLP